MPSGVRGGSVAPKNPNLPSFKDYRVENSAAMVPDRGFTKQLEALDPELRVVWAWGSEKWEIWRFPKDSWKEPFHCMTVQTKGRSYRELGTDILIKLQAADPWKYSLKELIAYWDEMDEQIQRRKRKKLYDKIHSITLDSMNYMRGVLQVQVPQKLKVRRAIADAS